MRPRLLDLFCGAGGAAMGYHRAGFEVVGVDIVNRTRYPFEFHQGDAIEYLSTHGHEFDAIHASPPCQAYSASTAPLRSLGREYPDLLSATREALVRLGKPWIIENVPGAPMRADIELCGCQVGLPRIRRRRWFETSWRAFLLLPTHHHDRIPIPVVGNGAPSSTRKALGYTPSTAELHAVMGGMDWMSRTELSLSIPPEYTEVVGRSLRAHLENEAAA